MNIFSFGNYLTPYLLAASVVLLGVLTMESRNLVQPVVGKTQNASTDTRPLERSRYTAPSIAAFSEIIERPLFMQDRVPPAPDKKPVAVKASPLRLHLEGIALSPASKIALVRDLSTNKMLHLTTGMKHQGWELVAVTDTVAIFERDGQSEQLTLVDRNGQTGKR